MPPEEFHLRVTWPNTRAVPVDVEIDEPLDVGETVRPQRGQRQVHGIGPEELVSRPVLLDFLADITRAESGDREVDALCLSQRVPRLLELLDVTYPIPDPIIVELPKDAR